VLNREEIQKSQAVCIAVSTAYKATYPSYTGPPVNFGSIDQSSKTLAQLAAVINLRPVADYITLLDDDTLLPATWCLEEIDRTWRIAVTTFYGDRPNNGIATTCKRGSRAAVLFNRDPDVQCIAYPLRAARRYAQARGA